MRELRVVVKPVQHTYRSSFAGPSPKDWMAEVQYKEVSVVKRRWRADETVETWKSWYDLMIMPNAYNLSVEYFDTQQEALDTACDMMKACRAAEEAEKPVYILESKCKG